MTSKSTQLEISMSSDQQKMYTLACDVSRLLSSDIPEEDVVIQIGGIVVSRLSLTTDII